MKYDNDMDAMLEKVFSFFSYLLTVVSILSISGCFITSHYEWKRIDKLVGGGYEQKVVTEGRDTYVVWQKTEVKR